jgi:hypothetical protein
MDNNKTEKAPKTELDCNAPISLAKGSIIDIFLLSKLPKEKYE